MRQLFAKQDFVPDKKQKTPVFPIQDTEAPQYNAKGYGIFWEVNEHQPRGSRAKEHVAKVLSWYCEFDGLAKEDQRRIIFSNLAPSLVIESKRGYHVYWDCFGACSLTQFDEIQKRLVYHYGADQSVKDISRVLRAPGFNHLKDPASPHRVTCFYRSRAKYTPKQMLANLAPVPKPNSPSGGNIPKAFITAFGQSLTDRINSIQNEHALELLSGTSAVKGDRFEFQPVSGGRKNIIVNGEVTASWIDADGRIGSRTNGGPMWTNWVNWYHHDWQKSFKLIREVFPQIFKDDK